MFKYFLCGCMLILLAACGSSAAAGSNTGDTTGGSTTAGTGTPAPVSTQALTPVGTTSVGNPPTTPIVTPLPTVASTITPTSGAVSIVLDATHFAAGSAIQLSIANGLTTMITTADHRSNCSMVTLQLQTATGWTDVAPCKLLTPTRLIELSAGSATPVTLGQAATLGTYRVQFNYSPGSGMTGSSNIVTSPTFTVS